MKNLEISASRLVYIRYGTANDMSTRTLASMRRKRSKQDDIDTGPQQTCPMILSKGKRKGQECGRNFPSVSNGYCKFHLAKTEAPRTCSMVLIKGLRKTLTCNRRATSLDHDLCHMHWLIELNRPKNPYIEHEKDIEIIKLITKEDRAESSESTVSVGSTVIELMQLNPRLSASIIALTGN